jgi:hypothetical protein
LSIFIEKEITLELEVWKCDRLVRPESKFATLSKMVYMDWRKRGWTPVAGGKISCFPIIGSDVFRELWRRTDLRSMETKDA